MKNKKYLVLALLFLLIGAGIASYAIYKSSAKGIGSLSAAKWSVKIKANGDDWSLTESNSISLTDSVWTNPLGNVAEGKIAPGSTTTFDVLIDASGTETSVDYQIVIGDLTNTPNLRVIPGAPGIPGEGTIPYSSNPNDMIKTIPIKVTWVGSINDNSEKDEIDLSYVNQTFTIPISVVTAQKLPGNDIPDEDTMNYYLETGGRARLVADIYLTDNSFAKNDLLLDLNGYTLDMGDKSLVPQSGLIITDTSSEQDGKITSNAQFVIQNGNSTTRGDLTIDGGYIEGKSAYGAIRNLGDLTINGGTIKGNDYVIYNESGANVEINGGEVISTGGLAVRLSNDSNVVFNNGLIKTEADDMAVSLSAPGAYFEMNGGKIEATHEVAGRGGLGIVAYKDTDVVINSGTIETYSFCMGSNGSISGNSEGSNASFTVNDGTFTSLAAHAMYLPQKDGITNINGGTFTGALNAIEIRAGNLNITDGTFISSSSEYNVSLNNSGTTFKGSAIGVSQHNTRLPINVNLTGGIYMAKVPFAIENPNGTSEEDLAKIHVNIEKTSSKPLKFVSSGDETVRSVIDSKFIKGGLYTHSVSNFIVSGYKELETNDGYEVVKE